MWEVRKRPLRAQWPKGRLNTNISSAAAAERLKSGEGGLAEAVMVLSERRRTLSAMNPLELVQEPPSAAVLEAIAPIAEI